jgi:hypothetical protein
LAFDILLCLLSRPIEGFHRTAEMLVGLLGLDTKPISKIVSQYCDATLIPALPAEPLGRVDDFVVPSPILIGEMRKLKRTYVAYWGIYE